MPRSLTSTNDPCEAKGSGPEGERAATVPGMERPDPLVSVVLPVRNEARHIEAVLRDLLAQELVAPDGSPFTAEFLVVDGESDDDTVARVEAMAQQDPRLRALNNPHRLSSGARAIGAAAAKGRYVAYVDGHCRLPGPRLLADMVALFEGSEADCLARPQPLIPEKGGYVAQVISAARTSPFGHSTRSTIYDDSEREVSPLSAGAMYRRDVFEKVGNYDLAFDACEDVEFNYRVEAAGLKCMTSPKLAVAYEPRASFRALFKQMRRYGLGRGRLHRKHPKAFSFESLIPAGFVLGLPVLPVALILGGLPGLVLAAPYMLYGLLSLVFSLLTAARKGWKLLPLLPVAFFVIHAGLGFGYLEGRLTRMPQPKSLESAHA